MLVYSLIMKKSLIFLGAVFLILIVIAIVGTIFVVIKGSRLDKESKQYADAAIAAIVSGWNKQDLVERASPEFMAATKDDDLNKLFALFRRLGRLKKYKGSEGQANISVTTQHGKVITANYVAKAEFDAGKAKIKVNLIKHDDNWQILGFNVDSKVFLGQE